MSIEDLIRNTFEADLNANGFKGFNLRGPTRFLKYQFDEEIISRYGWHIVGFRKIQKITGGKKEYSMEAAGIVTNNSLLDVFESAGFADSFVFSADTEVRKRDNMNYSDPIFDPLTGELKIRVTVGIESASPDWNALNIGLKSYLVLVNLSV